MLNLYSHFAIDDQFERMAPSLVFFFMLVCRMVVDWQFDKIPEEPKVATSSDHLILKKRRMLLLWRWRATMTRCHFVRRCPARPRTREISRLARKDFSSRFLK